MRQRHFTDEKLFVDYAGRTVPIYKATARNSSGRSCSSARSERADSRTRRRPATRRCWALRLPSQIGESRRESRTNWPRENSAVQRLLSYAPPTGERTIGGMRRIETVAGNTGYRHQLDRMRRFLDRAEARQASDVGFQDMMWAFFQNWWHLKDWLRNDPLPSAAQKAAVIQKAHDSDVLKMCHDLCNGTKHLGLDRKPRLGTGATHHHVDIRITPGETSTMDCMVEDGRGSLIFGKQLARDCVSEWERILQSEQLNTTRCS